MESMLIASLNTASIHETELPRGSITRDELGRSLTTDGDDRQNDEWAHKTG
jgi:hypothetical protein